VCGQTRQIAPDSSGGELDNGQTSAGSWTGNQLSISSGRWKRISRGRTLGSTDGRSPPPHPAVRDSWCGRQRAARSGWKWDYVDQPKIRRPVWHGRVKGETTSVIGSIDRQLRSPKQTLAPILIADWHYLTFHKCFENVYLSAVIHVGLGCQHLRWSFLSAPNRTATAFSQTCLDPRPSQYVFVHLTVEYIYCIIWCVLLCNWRRKTVHVTIFVL